MSRSSSEINLVLTDSHVLFKNQDVITFLPDLASIFLDHSFQVAKSA